MSSEVRFYDEKNNWTSVDFRLFDSNGDLDSTLTGAQNVDNVWEATVPGTVSVGWYDVVAITTNRTLGKEKIYWDGTDVLEEADAFADAVRTELSTELAHLISLENGLTAAQTTMLLEIYRLLGLDPTRPLLVTQTKRTVLPEIDQDLTDTGTQTTVQRV
jgi:hypothetical protein